MPANNPSPFDDASGQELLGYLASKGGAPAGIFRVVATGTDIDSAASTRAAVIYVTASSANTGIKLPAPTMLGQLITIINQSGHTLNVFPPSASETFVGLNPGDPFTISSGSVNMTTRVSATEWYQYF